MLTTSRGTLDLDHFPRHSALRPCQTLGRSSQVASKDESSTATVMRAILCRQLTFVSAAISNTTHSPEEQTRSPRQLLHSGATARAAFNTPSARKKTRSNLQLSSRLAAKTSDQHTLQRQHTTNHVKEWEAFKVPSVFSAAELHRLSMTIGLSSSRNSSLWRK